MIVVGLMGPAGAGKSTVADHLEARYGAKRFSLARPLKEIARRAMDFTEAQVYGSQACKEAEDERYGFSARWFLQRLGTEGIRSVLGADFWSSYCLRSIWESGAALAVIDDVRFTNEVNMIRALNVRGGLESPRGRGVVVRLHPVGESVSVDPGTHTSEREWLTSPADLDVRPPERGVAELLRMVDAALTTANVRPVLNY